jgi:hypothetical protein
MQFYPTYPSQTSGSNPQTTLSGQMYNVGTGSLGQAVIPGLYNAGAGQYNSGIGSPNWLQQVQQQNPVVSLPPPTGAYTSLAYRDPFTGNIFALCVDNAYAQILYDIIAMQGTNLLHARPVTITTVPDGEFSLDEMGQAEDLIQEIQHAH